MSAASPLSSSAASTREAGEAAAAADPAAPAPVTAHPTAAIHAELLSRVWQQSLPLMRQRVETLQGAARLESAGQLAAADRTGAADLAHKLAGSLGMFGYPRGTEIAREMEDMLEAPSPLNPVRFAELASLLRAALPL